MGVITVNNLSKSYYSREILKKINFVLDEGERLALIGENGSGKTTLMRIIAGIESPDEGQISIAQGKVLSYLSQQMEEFEDLSQNVLGSDKLSAIQNDLDKVSGLMAAATDIKAQDKLLKQYQKLSEQFEQLGGYTYLPKLAQALAKLGIAGEKLDRPIASLSGGERMRVLMARRLLENSDILLLDEPTNHLDIEGLEWLEEYLRSYKGTVLLISHDRYFLDKVATRTCELSAAKLHFYKGAYTDFVTQKANQTLFTMKSLERLVEERERQSEVKQTMLSHRNISAYHQREKMVAKLDEEISRVREQLPQNERRMNFRFIPQSDKRDVKRVLLQLEDAEMSWDDGQNKLFSGVNFVLNATGKMVLTGPNGCGKSTLLAMIMGKVQNYTGSLCLASGVRYGHLGQYTEFTNENRSALMELMERTLLLEGEARQLLARYGFRNNEVDKEIHVLSGGERARLYLCCLLKEEPDILFLDEPTNYLDIHSREILEEAIIDFNGAVLAVSHDRYFIEHCGFDIHGFINGQVRSYESYESYRHFVKLAEAESLAIQASAPPVKITKPASQAKPQDRPGMSGGLNLGKLRRELKELRIQIREEEAQIHALEEELGELEAALTPDNLHAFTLFAERQAALEELYESFFAKSQKAEAIESQLNDH